MTTAEFAVKLLKQYAKESGNTVRSTTDLGPLEEWLIIKLYNDSLTIVKPLPKLPSTDPEEYNPF